MSHRSLSLVVIALPDQDLVFTNAVFVCDADYGLLMNDCACSELSSASSSAVSRLPYILYCQLDHILIYPVQYALLLIVPSIRFELIAIFPVPYQLSSQESFFKFSSTLRDSS